MPGGLSATDVRVGGGHRCALLADRTVACWGLNAEGQLGRGSSGVFVDVALVRDLSGATAIALGHQHSCARTVADDVRCWGRNAEGEHGVGDLATNVEPEIVPLRHVP
jgi:alpha-tubulin suppressor-like RCC1 family protein